MPGTSKTITISPPPEVVPQAEEIMNDKGRTRNEVLRKALRSHMLGREWRGLARYGQQRAEEFGITPDDPERLIDEYRVSQN